ncbi:MAG: CRISPR-associated protein [Chloroflexi bacterium]|nr:CRISPR-associated protein [Chloroflexota bacterium]
MVITKTQNTIAIPRATGLLVIAVENANPNGDPDRESDPRQRNHDHRGYVSGVSFKRKLRDLVEEKKGQVWQTLKEKLDLQENDYCILESRDRGFKDVTDASDAWRRVVDLIAADNKGRAVANKYWDARVFGATFLEKGEEAPQSGSRSTAGDRKYIRTGVAHFGIALSVSPVRIHRDTNTKKASAQESKDRGMAPLACRYVEHGIYCMPFFVNPTAAIQSGCTAKDIALLLSLIRPAYANTRSVARSHGVIEVLHAWYAEHEDDLGSFSEFEFIEKLTPTREGGGSEKPSVSGIPLDQQYNVPTGLPKDGDRKFQGKLKKDRLYDLCVELPEWCNQFKGKGGNGNESAAGS